MKKNIVVCCEMMLVAARTNDLSVTGDVRGHTTKGTYTSPFRFCPWCGKKLPFPYEEEKGG